MKNETATNLMLSLLDYQDPDTGLRLSHTANDFIEPMNMVVGNAEILDGEETVGKVIFTLHLSKNALKLSDGKMDTGVMGQGVGTRYLPYVYEKLREAGVRYIYATDTTEIAANMYESAGWTEGLADLNLGSGDYGLDLHAQ